MAKLLPAFHLLPCSFSRHSPEQHFLAGVDGYGRDYEGEWERGAFTNFQSEENKKYMRHR